MAIHPLYMWNLSMALCTSTNFDELRRRGGTSLPPLPSKGSARVEHAWPAYKDDPHDFVTTAEAARILGYHGPATIRAYLSRYPGYSPTPDCAQMLPNGRQKDLSRRSIVWAFARRKGRATRTSQP
jgi:hypothetical protein